MALTATLYHFKISLSDLDRQVYEEIDLRVARHPSESFRYMVLRTLAYCLHYQDGITFSKGGISATDEPPVSVVDPTGTLLSWLDVGSPSADRLHKATKSAAEVAIFTAAELELLRREAASRTVHRLEEVAVWPIEGAFLDGLEPYLTRNCSWSLLRNEERLYLTVGERTFETALERTTLVPRG